MTHRVALLLLALVLVLLAGIEVVEI